MGTLTDYLDDYAARHPGWRERAEAVAASFFDGAPDVVDRFSISPSDCTQSHPELAGPNMDIGQCADCWMPVGVMRPDGESFGWHIADCSLPMRHPGYCTPGGNGHEIPARWKLRG